SRHTKGAAANPNPGLKLGTQLTWLPTSAVTSGIVGAINPPTNQKASEPSTVSRARYSMVAKPRRDFAYLNTPKATAPASSAVASTKAPKPWNCALEVVSMAKPPPSTAVAVISGRHRPHKSPKMEKTMRTNAKSPAPKPTVRGKVIRATRIKNN